MQANNFLKELRIKDLIFIPFIYLREISVSFNHWPLVILLVNMGQGLIQWQGLAFKKSAEVMGYKEAIRCATTL